MVERKLNLDKQWPLLTEDGRIPTKEFLETCNIILDVLDLLGHFFVPVKKDMEGNVNKLNSKYQCDMTKYQTLHEIVESELIEASYGIESLKWLKRGLHFIYLILDTIVEEYENGSTNNSLSHVCLNAYEISLKSHHNWFMQKFVFTCIRSPLCPKRNDLLKSLGCEEGKEVEVLGKIKIFISGLRLNLEVIFDLYYTKGLDNMARVK